MANTTAEQGTEPKSWSLKSAAFRVVRWFFYTVLLGIIPIVISFLWGHFLKQTNIDTFLSHGDLAILACALVGVSLGELMGLKEFRQPGIWEVLIGAIILTWTGSTFLLSVLAVSPAAINIGVEANCSWIALLASVLIGIGSFGIASSQKKF